MRVWSRLVSLTHANLACADVCRQAKAAIRLLLDRLAGTLDCPAGSPHGVVRVLLQAINLNGGVPKIYKLNQ
jgi:hypothetical protein